MSCAYLARLCGDLDEALTLVSEAHSVFSALGDRDGEALALNHLGCLHRIRGEHDASRVALEHSLRIRDARGDRRATGLTLCSLGLLSAAEGRVERAIGLLEQGLAGFRQTEDAPGLVGTSLTMASVYADAGGYEHALGLLPDALRESEHIPGNHRATGWGYALLSDVHDRLGRPDDANHALRRAGELFAALGSVDGAAFVRAAANRLQSRG